MASRAKLIKVLVTSDSKSLAGYKVLGDVTEGGNRVLVLERPESASAPRKARVKKAAATPAVAFPGTAVANG